MDIENVADDSQPISTQGDFYPVLDIIIEGRRGIKGDSGGTIISRVKEADICSEQDRFYITWATGTWLMTNCSDKYLAILFPNFLTYSVNTMLLIGENIFRLRRSI